MSDRRLTLTAVLGALLGTGGVALVMRGRELGPVDDAFISLRYAANWAAGEGLVFNPAERVEGFTSFLLVLIETLSIRLGFDAEVVAGGLGQLALVGLSAGVAFFAGTRLFDGRALPTAAIGFVFVFNPVLFCWAASGMESCLFAMLTFLASACATGLAREFRPVTAGVLLVLAAMTRPEAAALFPVLLLTAWFESGSRRRVGRFALVFAGGFGSYFALRAMHFGQLLPNTFYAKLDYGSGPLVLRGLEYVGQFARAVPLLTLAVVLALVWIRTAPRWSRNLGLIVGAWLAIVVYEGGDHFALFRFMVPLLGPATLLALGACRRATRHSGIAMALGILVLGVSSVTVARVKLPARQATELAEFEREVYAARQWARFGRHLRTVAPADASLGTIAIGAIGYHSGLRIVDPHGIVDPFVAHLPRALGRGYAGHEKYDLDRVFSQRPGYLLVLNYPRASPAREGELPGIVWGEFNRELIRDPRLARDYRLETLRLDNGYWSVHVRRDLPSLRR